MFHSSILVRAWPCITSPCRQEHLLYSHLRARRGGRCMYGGWLSGPHSQRWLTLPGTTLLKSGIVFFMI